jgi:hypothetical protein
MPIKVACPSCKATVNAPDKVAGKKCSCPRCGGVLHVPRLRDPARAAREDDPEAFDSPRRAEDRGEPRGGLPAWGWVLVAVGGVAILGGVVVAAVVMSRAVTPDKVTQRKTPDAGVVDWSQVGDTITFGDVTVTASYAIDGPAWGPVTNLPGPPRGDPLLYIKIRIENRSKTKLQRWSGWYRRGQVEDEHGNTYRAVQFPDNVWWIGVTGSSAQAGQGVGRTPPGRSRLPQV